MLLLVIYTSEMLTTWILLSGIEWVKLIFNYSQVWNVFTRWLFSVDSFRTETMTPWDDTFIKSAINVNIADLWSRSKNSETKFNESCARDWKCKPMNNYIVSTSTVYSHKFHSDLWSSSIAWNTQLWRLTSVIPLLSKAAVRTWASCPNYAWSESTAWCPSSVV